MSRKLISSIWHLIIAVFALGVVLLWVHSLSQVLVIGLAALIGFRFIKITKEMNQHVTVAPISKKAGFILLSLFFLLLIGLPAVSPFMQYEWFILVEKFYLSGALVFGGGHVVLPLLEVQFVQSGLMSSSDFITGYGMTQAVPGPLFTFASYIGMMIAGVPGAIIATIAFFFLPFYL